MKKIVLSLAMALPLTAAAITPLWMRDVKISPDGSTIAFCYRGDLYTVPATGGSATRLTATNYYEQTPVWSPDSRSIAYSSDEHGYFDVYIIDARGGAATRLTYTSVNEVPETFTPDGANVLFSAAIQDPVSSASFPTGRLTELYSVPAAGGAALQVLSSPAFCISYLADGRSFLYQDQKGMENNFRKHHTSSVTRDIWLYDAKTGRHTNLTNCPGENLSPVAAGDKFYFLSERTPSSINVYEASIANPADAHAITSFKDHPVRFLSRADNGTLAFGYDGEIYTLTPGGKPVKVAVEVTDYAENEMRKMSVTNGASECAVSPDGKSIAFVYRGEVFVTSVEYDTTRRITSTAEAEEDPCWAPDGKTLYYTSQRDGRYNIYKATMPREEDKDFVYATLIKEERVFDTDKHERAIPQVSPDGKYLGFVLDRQIIAVMDLKSGKVRKLTSPDLNPQLHGGVYYQWSPDSKRMALTITPPMHEPYDDVAILDVETGEITNVTNSGYFDSNPRWVLGGRAIIFASERFGMRNHASWGSLYDVMITFLDPEAYDEFQLSKEERELLPEKEKKDDEEEQPINVDLTNLELRTARLTPQSIDIVDAMLTADGSALYYVADDPNGRHLWKIDFEEEEHQMLSKVARASSIQTSADGKKMFLLGSTMRKLDASSGKLTPISYDGEMTLDLAAERAFEYEYVVREEGARFYLASMHGVDWPKLTDHYRQFLPHISNNYDFSEMLSELLGELNVSHTGSGYRSPTSSQDDETADLGLLYDLNYAGQGLRVAEVVANSPFNNAKSKVAVGTVVCTINGKEITNAESSSQLLTDLVGKRTLIGLLNPATGERWEEVIKPISRSDRGELLYKRWVRSREALVDSLSGGRLGYVHIPQMDDEAFRTVYSALLGKFNNREGVVIDIRWNGGGRLHEDIEVLLSGQQYFVQEIRGHQTCNMPSRRWNKPSIMVMNEACYSNAHGTPWVYKHCGIGQLVGMPVPGTMTSVNWVTLQDRTLYFGIPVIGYHLPDGSFLENQQLNPDIQVSNDPAEEAAGRDAQIEAAVEALLRQIDGK